MSSLFRMRATSILLWTATLAAQGQTLLDLKSQGRNVDFSGAVATKPFRVGTALPAICNVGEAFFKSDAAPGSNLYTCTATNTWTVQSGAGGGAALPSTTNLVKGNGSGGGLAANPGVDYYKPGMSISTLDLPPNIVTTDAQNTFTDPGNEYLGKYDVACDATGVSADNLLVKKDSTGKCVALTTSDASISSGFVGVLVSGSTTVNGRVRKLGVGDVKAYGTINTGDWIFASTHTGGYVEGSSSRPAPGTFIVGRANAPAGATVPVDINIDPNAGSASAITLQTNGANNGSQTILNLKAGPGVNITDDGSGGVTVAAVGAGGASITRGAFAARPVCNSANNGAMYIYTDSRMEYALCDGTSWHSVFRGIEMTPMAAFGSYSWADARNQTPAVTTSHGTLEFLTTAANGTYGDGYRRNGIQCVARPAAPFTKTFALEVGYMPPTGSVDYLLGWFESASNKYQFLGFSANWGASSTPFLSWMNGDNTSDASPARTTWAMNDNSAFMAAPWGAFPRGATQFIQLTDDGSTMSVRVSTDGRFFSNAFSQTYAAAGFVGAPDKLCFGITGFAQGLYVNFIGAY
jgi:hypothetical protein